MDDPLFIPKKDFRNAGQVVPSTSFPSGAKTPEKPGTVLPPSEKKGSFLSYIQKANIRPSPQDIPAVSVSDDPPVSSSPLKRTLPDEIKSIIEGESRQFADFAQKKQEEEGKTKTDPWDEAILTGKYPEGHVPTELLRPTVEVAPVIPEVTAPTTPPIPTVEKTNPIPVELRRFNVKQAVSGELKPISISAPSVKVSSAMPIPKKPQVAKEAPAPVRYEGFIAKPMPGSQSRPSANAPEPIEAKILL